MKAYRSFAKTLDQLLDCDEAAPRGSRARTAGPTRSSHAEGVRRAALAVRISVPGYMPLSVERIGTSGDGNELIAISHTAVQNGDLMRDPEVVFEIHILPEQPAAGTELISRADWSRKHRDFKGTTDGVPSMLQHDPTRGSVLVPVTITDRHAEPISFRNDFLGAYQEACTCDHMGRRTGVNSKLRTQLDTFARIWFKNLREQGFLAKDATREVLA